MKVAETTIDAQGTQKPDRLADLVWSVHHLHACRGVAGSEQPLFPSDPCEVDHLLNLVDHPMPEGHVRHVRHGSRCPSRDPLAA